MHRRHIWRLIATAALAMTFASIALPATASAADTNPCAPYACGVLAPEGPDVVGPGHKGWVYLNLNTCPSGMVCAAIYRDSMAAWRWTGSSWTQATLRQGWVYVYPYTGIWRWVWTQQGGWVATSTGTFEKRAY